MPKFQCLISCTKIFYPSLLLQLFHILVLFDKVRYTIYDMIYLLTANGLTPGGSSTVHVYAQTVHRTTQSTRAIRRTKQLTTRTTQ